MLRNWGKEPRGAENRREANPPDMWANNHIKRRQGKPQRLGRKRAESHPENARRRGQRKRGRQTERREPQSQPRESRGDRQERERLTGAEPRAARRIRRASRTGSDHRPDRADTSHPAELGNEPPDLEAERTEPNRGAADSPTSRRQHGRGVANAPTDCPPPLLVLRERQ